MFFEMCKCDKCGSTLEPDTDKTIQQYQEEFDTRRVIYPSEEPPEVFTYFIMKCNNSDCGNIVKKTHDEVLSEVRAGWSKIAWSYHVSEEKNRFNFHEHFTKYIKVNGLDKMITQKDLDTNEVLKDYVRYVEGELTEDGDS